ncbi:hypothetical protein Anas_12791 [Armadillidium nasatum]|uniref:Uncharacterized protein n=1 Tax=Armadillidium nasatum TaxID=96803 RepID=A0A5N5T9K1_9CRUS|nr:hypothetical protein Anas_12791 [Armadillidium nasatum]
MKDARNWKYKNNRRKMLLRK